MFRDRSLLLHPRADKVKRSFPKNLHGNGNMSSPISISLEGKILVVTGAGRGIGQAMAMALAEAGGSLAVVSRTREEVERTAHRIRQAGGSSAAFLADVRDATQVEVLADRIVSRFGRVDVLVTAPECTAAGSSSRSWKPPRKNGTCSWTRT